MCLPSEMRRTIQRRLLIFAAWFSPCKCIPSYFISITVIISTAPYHCAPCIMNICNEEFSNSALKSDSQWALRSFPTSSHVVPYRRPAKHQCRSARQRKLVERAAAGRFFRRLLLRTFSPFDIEGFPLMSPMILRVRGCVKTCNVSLATNFSRHSSPTYSSLSKNRDS